MAVHVHTSDTQKHITIPVIIEQFPEVHIQEIYSDNIPEDVGKSLIEVFSKYADCHLKELKTIYLLDCADIHKLYLELDRKNLLTWLSSSLVSYLEEGNSFIRIRY